MDSIRYSAQDRNNPLRIVLKDRSSELKRMGLERLLSAVYQRPIILPVYLEELGVERGVVEILQLQKSGG